MTTYKTKTKIIMRLWGCICLQGLRCSLKTIPKRGKLTIQSQHSIEVNTRISGILGIGHHHENNWIHTVWFIIGWQWETLHKHIEMMLELSLKLWIMQKSINCIIRIWIRDRLSHVHRCCWRRRKNKAGWRWKWHWRHRYTFGPWKEKVSLDQVMFRFGLFSLYYQRCFNFIFFCCCCCFQ